jgi:PIN domain nuclease of toxin-antitoxin system
MMSSPQTSGPERVVDLLLDTHVALWWAADAEELDPDVRRAVAEPANTVWTSAASAWELAIKVRAGKLVVDVRSLFGGLVTAGIRILGIGVDDAVAAGALDWDHRDPFDRMLVAQATRHRLVLVTRDAAILAGDRVQTLPA